MNKKQSFLAKGNMFKRFLTLPLLYLAWFSPHKKLRVFFHRLRGVKIGSNVEIGYFCIIGNVHPHMIKIEDNVVVTARTTILEHDNSYYYTGRGKVNFGEVNIKEGAFIGIGAVVMPNVIIGSRAIVGALAFVNRNVHENTVVVGNPAKAIN